MTAPTRDRFEQRHELQRLTRLAAYAREQAERAELARRARDEAIVRAADELGMTQRHIAQVTGLAKSGICRIVGSAPAADSA